MKLENFRLGTTYGHTLGKSRISGVGAPVRNRFELPILLKEYLKRGVLRL